MQQMMAMASDLGDLFSTFGNVGAFALVAWLVRHTFSHTIPRLAADFRESIDAQRHEFLEELRRINDENREERRECMNRMEELSREVVLLRRAVEAG